MGAGAAPMPEAGGGSGRGFLKRGGHGGKKMGVSDLPLTPLVDFMVVLVIFLIQSFSADPTVSIPSDVRLPLSVSEKGLKMAVTVAVSSNVITMEGYPVANVEDVTKMKDSLIIPGLADGLRKKKEQSEAWSAAGIEGSEFKGDVIITSDKEIPFDILMKIMATCGDVGYGNLSLAVQKKG